MPLHVCIESPGCTLPSTNPVAMTRHTSPYFSEVLIVVAGVFCLRWLELAERAAVDGYWVLLSLAT